MGKQELFSEADRIYGAWLAARGRLNAIDHGQQAYDAQRTDLQREMEALAMHCCELVGEQPK